MVENLRFGGKRGGLKGFLSLTMVVDPPLARTLARLPPGARICDIGSGGRRLDPQIICVDGFRTKNTDLICDIHQLALREGVLDCAVCTGTLEHVEDPSRGLKEIHRSLRPQGIVHVEVPFLQGYHPDPEDYWRWTLPGLRLFCRRLGFEEIESGVHMGPSSTLAWTISAYVQGIFRARLLRRLAARILKLFLFPLKYLDLILARRDHAHHVASGVFFVGRKVGKDGHGSA